MLRVLLSVAVVAVAAVLSPAAAAAPGQISVSGGEIVVEGTSGADSVAAMQRSATWFVFQTNLAPGAGCSRTARPMPTSSASSGGISRIRMDLGAGDDVAAGRRIGFFFCFPPFIPCPPPLSPVAKPLVVDAGSGDDLVNGGTEDDTLEAGPGRDFLTGGGGGDELSGGSGIDEVSYAGASSRVVVTLDDQPDDGVDSPSTEGDNVRSDVEDVTGGNGDDVLAGDGDGNQLSGGPGSDQLDGGGGFDMLYGGTGVDQLRARDGNPERVDCGAENDFAVVDAFDATSGCENADASAALQADLDHDGIAAPADCDDHDPAIRPGAADAPDNGIDENCDGADATLADRDHDGFRAPQDCDDADPAIRPGAQEVFGNRVDEDCNGRADPFQTIESTVQSAFQNGRKSTRVRRLRVTNVRAGTVIRVRCPGSRKRRACRRSTTTIPVTRSRARRRPAQAARTPAPPPAHRKPHRRAAPARRLADPDRDVPLPRRPQPTHRRAVRAARRDPHRALPVATCVRGVTWPERTARVAGNGRGHGRTQAAADHGGGRRGGRGARHPRPRGLRAGGRRHHDHGLSGHRTDSGSGATRRRIVTLWPNRPWLQGDSGDGRPAAGDR